MSLVKADFIQSYWQETAAIRNYYRSRPDSEVAAAARLPRTGAYNIVRAGIAADVLAERAAAAKWAVTREA